MRAADKTKETPIGKVVEAVAEPATGEVVAMGEDFLEVDELGPDHDDFSEITEQALVPADIEACAKGIPVRISERRAESRTGRRATLPSGIPAMLAKSMVMIGEGGRRDPAAPRALETHEVTRPIEDNNLAGLVDRSAAPSAGLPVGSPHGQLRRHVEALIANARACMDAGDLGGAVLAADEIMAECESAPPPGLRDVLDPARPLLGRIYSASVGLLNEIPVLARSEREIAALGLDEKTMVLISWIDGRMTLGQIFNASQIPSPEAFGITAALMRAGIMGAAPPADGTDSARPWLSLLSKS
jgi:hypothetical protein